MNTPFRKAMLCAGVLGCCALQSGGGPAETVNAQVSAAPPSTQATVFDLFLDGAVNTHPGPRDPATATTLDNSDIGKAYYQIHPERSILIYDCTKAWCKDPGKPRNLRKRMSNRWRRRGTRLRRYWTPLL